jgi:hypothetical protein
MRVELLDVGLDAAATGRALSARIAGSSGDRTCLGVATFALERFLSDLELPGRRLYVPVPGAASG